MSSDYSKQSSSLVARFCFLISLVFPVVAFCLLCNARSGRDGRFAWLIWTVLATVVLPLWHFWLHWSRTEGSFAARFHSVMATSGRRIGALLVFTLPLLMVVAGGGDSDFLQFCAFVWVVGLFILCCLVALFLAGAFDDADRQTVDLAPLLGNHCFKGTISIRKGGYRF